MTIGCRVNWQNFIKSAFLSLSVLRYLTFRQISRRPVVVEGWKYHHSTHLDLPVRMVVFSFFYDHWMLSYSTKRLSSAVPNVIKCRFDNISPINSASICRRGMNLLLFDSSLLV